MTTVQYQLSNGAWIDCGTRADQFIDDCVAYSNGTIADRAAALEQLAAGKILRHASGDWSANCRAKPAPVVRPADPRPLLHCKRCGQTGHDGAYPFSTLRGTSICDDCA